MLNPISQALRINDRFDYSPKGLSNENLEALLSGEGHEMQLEPVTLEEVEHTYLAGYQSTDEMLLSAITSRRNRLHKTMAAFVKQLNKSLSGTDIKAGVKSEFYDDGGMSQELSGVKITNPRKVGLVAVMTAQIPCSDGQSVSIVFYAPDDDPLKINSDDTLIAFRFLLNKRDITHIVSPNRGKDISLAQTTMSLSNALERNSAKFKANLNKSMGARKELADKQELLEQIQDEITGTLRQVSEIDTVNQELTTRKGTLQEQLSTAEIKHTGLTAKLAKFEPVEPPASPVVSLEKGIEATRNNIQKWIVPEIEKAIAEAVANGDRAEFPKEQKDQIRTYYLSFVMEDAALKDHEQIKFLGFAVDSLYADTALNELQNGGWAEVAAPAPSAEPIGVTDVIKQFEPEVQEIAKSLHALHSTQGVSDIAMLPENVSDRMRDILGEMYDLAGKEEVEQNSYGKDLKDAFLSVSAEEAYTFLRNSWAIKLPELSEKTANDDDVSRGYKILTDLDSLSSFSELINPSNVDRFIALQEIAMNLPMLHPKGLTFYDAFKGTFESLAKFDVVTEMESELSKAIRYCVGLKGENLADRLRVAASTLQRAIDESEASDGAKDEKLEGYLKALSNIAAGGFVVEEAVDLLTVISDYFESALYWEEHHEQFDAAANLVADAIEARMEIQENA